MLKRLLRLLEENQGELDLVKTSQLLGAQPGAVTGMVETLVRKGRLVEMRPTCGNCELCGIKNQCELPAKYIKQYRIVNHPSQLALKS